MAGFSVHDLGDPAGEPHGKRARGGKADHDEDEREHDAKGGTVKLARGGNSSMSDKGASDKKKEANVYNAAGSPTMDEAKNETPSFNKGGRMKRKAGGTAEGFAAGGRLDQHARRANGGSTRTPYSSGSVLSAPQDDRPGRGYENSKPA